MKIILLLVFSVFSSNAWAELVCGQIKTHGECFPGFECVQFKNNDTMHTFDKDKTSQEALDSLFFAIKDAEALRGKGNSCLIIDKKGVLKLAKTFPTYQAQVYKFSKISKS